MSKKTLLFAASEVYPFTKTGGLADVAHALPKALASECRVCVVTPLYRTISRKRFRIKPLDIRFSVSMGGVEYPVELYGYTKGGVEYRFVDSPLLCDRDFLYGTPEAGYGDNALRFAIFGHAIVRMLETEHYDVAHLNDWQCGWVPLLLRERPDISTKTVFTIHNLAYQGVSDASAMETLGLAEHYFTMDGIEFYGRISPMKAGIAYADRITTVSPTYAQEILTERFGCGLEGFLRLHREKLSGILNGIDTEIYSPRRDALLEHPFDDLKGKKKNKSEYLKSIGKKGDHRPLFVFIGRYTHQKGLDLLIPVLKEMAGTECTVAFLGEGDGGYEEALSEAAAGAENIHVHHGYDEALSHRLYAAADFLIMPSLFEPCGLAQLIAFAYGTLPIVHRVGGLADTVHPLANFEKHSSLGYGIVFGEESSATLSTAISEAIALYGDKRRLNAVLRHNMECDFSWDESARAYRELYRSLEE